MQEKINQILESGSERFHKIKEGMEGKALVTLLSELSAKLDALQRKVDEQEQVIGQVSRQLNGQLSLFN